MSRTYFVLALANMALRDSEYLDDACEIIDAIIENTLEVESKKGFEHFILSYGHHGGVGRFTGSQHFCGWGDRTDARSEKDYQGE